MPTQVRRKKQITSIVSDADEIIDTHISDDHLSTDDDAGVPAISVLTPVVTIEATQVTPIIPSAQTSRSVRAHDVDYFFLRGSKKTNVQAVCKVCKYVKFKHSYSLSSDFLNVY